jgi:hypothetical protein
VSPFLEAVVGGVIGGIASGLVISAMLALFGRRVAEGLLHQQVAYLESRFKDHILDVMLGRIASFLDQGERIGQIVRRAVEIVQLLLRHGAAEAPGVSWIDGAIANAKNAVKEEIHVATE